MICQIVKLWGEVLLFQTKEFWEPFAAVLLVIGDVVFVFVAFVFVIVVFCCL